MPEISFKNADFIKNTKALISLIRNNFKGLILYTLIAFFIGILYSFTLTPTFRVNSTISPSDEAASVMESTGSIFSTLLGGNMSTTIDQFLETMFSSPVAEKMWNEGYNEILFAINYDPEAKKYLRREPTTLESLRSWILGYEIDREITHLDLKDFLIGSFQVDPLIGTANYNIYSLTDDPVFYKKMMLDLLKAGDTVVKQDKL
ncbi:uncharacterized protein METZ01_LOCUS507458, partial [marine metagenome]